MTTALEQLQHWLREQHIPYSTQHHRPVFTAQEVAAEVHEKGEHVAKVVIAKTGGQMVMVVVPASEQVDFERVAELLHMPSAQAAQEKEFQDHFSDCEPGAMPPFGEMYDLPTYLDESLARTRTLVFQAGTHRDTIKLPTADYLRLAKPITAKVARPHSKGGARG